MTVSDFASLGLAAPLLRALEARDYVTPTPIQAQAIPHLLEGRDLLGIAQTGTGKTAAFSLPMLQILAEVPDRADPLRPRALVLAPTRELATQIADSCKAYGKHLHLRTAVIFGGVGQMPQVQALRQGVDILIATPGRLLDLIQQRHCGLDAVEILVLDEADRMLDMGFLPDVRRILGRLPKERQSLLFSATMPRDIVDLAHSILHDPVRVEVTPQATTVERIEQSVYFVKKDKKRELLVELLADPVFERTLVFTRTKHGADRVAKFCSKAGIEAHAIHGNKSQGARERALSAFKGGKCHVLVATDIAARGIDVKDITHVVNFDLPNVPESYVHRIGRTARAGRDGIAIAFCDETEHEYLRDIEKLIKRRIPVVGQGKPPAPPAAEKRSSRPKPAVITAPTKPNPDNPWDRHAMAEVARSDRDAQEVDDRDAFGAEAPVDQAPRQRQRPAQRSEPGPYEPSPRQGHRPYAPRHERGGKPQRGGRPAQPNAVDPEQRRREPRPQPSGHGPQRPHGSPEPHRQSGPHKPHSPHKSPAPHKPHGPTGGGGGGRGPRRRRR